MSDIAEPLCDDTTWSVLDETFTLDNTTREPGEIFEGHEPATYPCALTQPLSDEATAIRQEAFSPSRINRGPEEPFDGHEVSSTSPSDESQSTAALSSAAVRSELVPTLQARSPSGHSVTLVQSTLPIDDQGHRESAPSSPGPARSDVTSLHLSPMMGAVESSTDAASPAQTQTEILNQYVDALDAATHQFSVQWTEAERTWPHDFSLRPSPNLVVQLAIARAGGSISATRKSLSVVQSTLDSYWQDTRTNDKRDTAKGPSPSEAKPKRTSTERRTDRPSKDPPARSTTNREQSWLSQVDQTAKIAVSFATVISIGAGVIRGSSYISKGHHR